MNIEYEIAISFFYIHEVFPPFLSRKGTDHEADWLDGVVVALDWLRKSTQGKKVGQKKIVLISDLGGAASEDKLDLIVKGMESEGVEFTFIGPHWGDEDGESGADGGEDGGAPAANNGASSSADAPEARRKPKSAAQQASEAMVGQIVTATEGLLCNIDDALAHFTFRDRRRKRPFPWKATLEIGSDVRISTVGYIQVRREAPKTWKKTLARKKKGGDEPEELKAETTFVRNNEDEETVEPDDLVESYKYGSDVVPVTEDDKANHKYDGGPKSLAVFGCVKQDDIQRNMVLGDGCMVFQPVEGDEVRTVRKHVAV